MSKSKRKSRRKKMKMSVSEKKYNKIEKPIERTKTSENPCK